MSNNDLVTILKCKMCDGALDVRDGENVAVCQYCGTVQTLPKINEQRRANLYDRAGHFRRNNEYDKAMALYEQILYEDITDAEAYWSIVLCRYGIEYVEDPQTHRRVPTVNRAQLRPIFADKDYKLALENSDGRQRFLYEEEAKAIDAIQRGILEISQKEEPFDVFICYKELDERGRRTPDSVLAQDIYQELRKQGFKVFFSRITLEDKIGVAYEPYIFGALQSSKVMVVVCTNAAFLNSVWVKNEWSRYLALIKDGAEKTLIPAYRDMDPYNLPDEFSHLQAQDMGKLGFMQDLVRGIRKLAGAEESNVRQIAALPQTMPGVLPVEPLVKRAFLFLEDGDWGKADELLEQALNLDPENPKAYVGKLMAERHVRLEQDLANEEKLLDESVHFVMAMRFADEGYQNILSDYNKPVFERLEARRKEAERLAEERHMEALRRAEERRIQFDRMEEERRMAKVRNRKIAIFCLAAVGLLVLILSSSKAITNAKAERLLLEAGKDMIEPARTGEIVYYGEYAGKALAWQVLEIKDDRVLLVTKDCIAQMPYNYDETDITWEGCSLRRWLDPDFLKSFSRAQKSSIAQTNTINNDNAQYGTDGGNDTVDRVFLLSIEEALAYFPSDKTRIAKLDGATSTWWLRSPGYFDNSAAYVGKSGAVLDFGYGADNISGVRPALWLNLESFEDHFEDA